MLEMTGLAPGAEHIDHADVASAQGGGGQARGAVKAGQLEGRRCLPDQDGGNACWIAGAEPLEQEPRERHEDDERQVDEPSSSGGRSNGFSLDAHQRPPSLPPRAPSSARVAWSSWVLKRRKSKTTQPIMAPMVATATA